ncbi:MAG: 6-phosphofructokinase [Chloroflexi bacterium]|uniref:6-phosphofructokinase n=1 Tax=Candidatus Chlorohelix allophototropha TaxID=3003348 RepID=A0A8T7LV19_9CHLR|nr:6-phosphofructokinase [Chloroflexota bacterium]WJW67742.1 6-phosphofructokinase [Chloroflexota bacterium L227-S17]
MTTAQEIAIGVLTSGGDAQGMNAALRAIVRSAIIRNATVYAIYEGYKGMVQGGDLIREMTWNDVGGILQRGGTVIGTARCAEFRTREGRLEAAFHLVERGIDRLVIIGGDGSLTGANIFRQEWSSLVAELVGAGRITKEEADKHPFLGIVGLVGSIDNDMYGTDMTIGADTALHRITEALDALTSTAASHQRTFVVEVMGRNCGYLALMSAVAGGADWVLIPENPPDVDDWEQYMCDLIRAGRKAGRRESIVVVAEGARDKNGCSISSDYIRKVLQERLGEDTRVTILGHVQRGGSPSAFDRWMSTLVGYMAVEELLNSTPESEPQLIGIRYNRITHTPLMQDVEQTRALTKHIAEKEYAKAMELRGGSFREMYNTFQALAQALPSVTHPEKVFRFGILNAGAPAPGMNTAVRAAVRLVLDRGHSVLGIHNGFEGLINGDIRELEWGDVDGWTSTGGAELGTSRLIPSGQAIYSIARNLETYNINALLVVGGWECYETIYKLHTEQSNFPAFNIPMICLPASIDNNLPGSELSIGADTALNNIVEVVDKIKQSAVAARRCFVVEVMGRYCGYLALMSGLATGAERVYLHEEGIRLQDLQNDLQDMTEGFKHGKRLSLMIRNENANSLYTTSFLCSLFEEEGRGIFDVRQAILGHLQEGGNPSPFDRIQATRLAARCVKHLIEQLETGKVDGSFIGIKGGKVEILDIEEMPRMVDPVSRRPKDQWWLNLRTVARLLARDNPK